ncbi:hypothetical protein MMC11_008211, partial [Xylographa trunciseda]|nr:hypothetical protein [Xylographa trunciseda]
LLNDWATLIVGPEKKTFKMHEGLLCSISPFFKAALEGDFKEAQEHTIELIDDDPEIMEYFQLWLYTQSILDHEETVSDIEWGVLLELYVLREIRLISTLQNQVIDLMIRKLAKANELPGLDMMCGSFARTFPKSSLRKFLIEASARVGTLDEWSWDFTEGNEVAQRDYLNDLVLELYNDRENKQRRDFWKIRCTYHTHAEGEPRCSENTPNPDMCSLLKILAPAPRS